MPGLYDELDPTEAFQKAYADEPEPAPRSILRPSPGQLRDVAQSKFTGITGSAVGASQRGLARADILRVDHERRGVLDTVTEQSVFEGHTGYAAEQAKTDFMSNDSDRAFIQGAPAEDVPDEEPWYTARNIANTIFSDEMGLLGVKWTEESVTWNFDNFKNQLVEHPYSTAFTIGTYLVPIGAAWLKGTRMAQRAAKIAKNSSGMIEDSARVVKARGLFGTIGGDEIAEMTTWKAMKALGPRVRFDDHAKMVKAFAFSDEVSDGKKFFNAGADGESGLWKRIRDAGSDEEIAKFVPEKELRKMLIGDMHTERFMRLKALQSQGKLSAMQTAELKVWRQFGNTYAENLTDGSREMIEGMDAYLVKEGISKWVGAAPLMANKAAQEVMYKFSLGRASKAELLAVSDDAAVAFGEGMGKARADLLRAQVDEGFESEATFNMFKDIHGDSHDLFGPGHMPAVTKDTPGFTDLSISEKRFLGTSGDAGAGRVGELVAHKDKNIARMLAPDTMKQRAKRKDWATIKADLGKLETDPLHLTVGGFVRDNVVFQLHRSFRDVLVESITKGPNAGKFANWTASADEIAALPKSAQRHWINFEEMEGLMPGLGARMRSMVEKKLEKDGLPMPDKLPLMSREVVEQFFGKEGSAKEAAGMFGKLFQLGTAVHKTSATALNVPSHVTNTLGNYMFLAMAGMNPISVRASADAKVFTHAFAKLATQMKRAADTKAPKTIDDLMSEDNLAMIFKDKDRYITTIHGDKVDLAKVFADPEMKKLVEAQAFDSTEGWGRAKALVEQFEHLGDDFGSTAVKGVAKVIAGVGELRPIKATLHVASSSYLAEDMIPKMMYVSHLLRKGWAPEAIVKEVGRRLPQYRTVGTLQRKARNVVLPWITFSAEAARITKNNLMDSPISMMAWMQAPQIAQSVAIASGVGLTPEEIHGTGVEGDEGVVGELPAWAVKPSSIYLQGEKAAPAIGAFGAGVAGGLAGAAAGGAVGAAVGVGAGGYIGWLMGKKANEGLSQQELSEVTRTMTMDFLPQSAISFATSHPHTWERIDPFNDKPFSGPEVTKAVLDVSPVAPAAIALDAMNIMMGRDAFGKPLETGGGEEGGGMQLMGKMALGLIGFGAPPVLQKYGMRLGTRGQGAYVPGMTREDGTVAMADIHDDNGGQMTLPKDVEATYYGVNPETLSSIAEGGAEADPPGILSKQKTGLGLGGLFAAATYAGTRSKTAAAVTGAIGYAGGREINTRRLMTDLGIMGDAYTNVKGDWTMDFFMNNVTGINKSYKASTAAAIDHDNRSRQRIAEIRSIPAENYKDAIRNGQPAKAVQHLEEVYKLFVVENGLDHERAFQKFIEWADRAEQSFAVSAQMAGLNKEQRIARIAQMKLVKEHTSRFFQRKLQEMENADTLKRSAKVGRLKLSTPY